jgi:hypothetical protein
VVFFRAKMFIAWENLIKNDPLELTLETDMVGLLGRTSDWDAFVVLLGSIE